MLQQVCDFIHNYFIRDSRQGQYEIVDGAISLPFVKDGQRFMIFGSDLNDGMYTYHAAGVKDDDDTAEVGLRDETFAGTICALAVPPAVIALSGEIKAWVEQYGDKLLSPFESESVIGVYSYEKLTNSKVGGRDPSLGWQEIFSKQLKRWRKVSFY